MTIAEIPLSLDLWVHSAVAYQHGEAEDENRLRRQLHDEALQLPVHQLLLVASLHCLF